MKSRFFYIFLATIVSLHTANNTQAASQTFTLKNGDRITGEIINAQNPLGLWIKTTFGQNIQIPWTEIVPATPAVSHQTTSAPAQTAAAKRITLRPPPYDGSTVAVAESSPVASNTPAPVPVTTDTKDKKPTGVQWSGRINFGATFQTGNSEQETVNIDGQTKARWGDHEQHRATLKGEMNREKNDDNVTENNRQIEGKYDYFYTKKWFINNALKLEQDDIDDIELRSTASIGIGHQAYDEDDLKLQYVFGPTYLREAYETGSETENSFAARWALEYEQQIIEDLLRFYHEHEILVPTEDTEDFLLDSKTGVRIPIRKGLVASAEIDFEWDNLPESGIKEDDTKYIFKVGYEWE